MPYVSVDKRGQIAVVTIDNKPVNAMSVGVRKGILEAIHTTDVDPEIKAVVLCCAGRTFIAGADITEFDKPPQEPHLPDVVLALENARKPWVAAIHGTALGGGVEIALGCAFRVAVKAAKIGFPEVNLGLLPGAGGTVRLPYLVGPDAALDMIASGKPVSATKAKEIGLIDQVVDGDLLENTIEFTRNLADSATVVPILQRPQPAIEDVDVWEIKTHKLIKKARGAVAVRAIVDVIENSLLLPPKQALALERRLFVKLKSSPQSAALRYIFFAERAVSKIARTKGIKARPISQVGVIGGGTMGAGIIAATLLSGFSAVLIERDDASLELGAQRVKEILTASQSRGVISAEKFASLMGEFRKSTDYASLSNCDFVIEAVFEDMDVKKQVFARLDKVTRPDAILATNTSYLDVAEIAQAVTYPSRVLGLHFFSPAHIMKLLEIIHHPDLADDALMTAFEFGKRLGKISVPSGICDGFIGNRIMSAYRRECDYMLEDGALPHQIDAAMLNFGFPMGIYQMQDMAGLDISWMMRKRQSTTRDPSERYVKIADVLCEAGRFGRKTDCGWYDYKNQKQGAHSDWVEAVILQASAASSIKRRKFSEPEIIERILQVMQAESQKILAEGIAETADAIDVVLVNGYGFPRWKAGPMYMQSLAPDTAGKQTM